jgi:hypothetical protein
VPWVQADCFEHPTDPSVVDNVVMFYDEMRETLAGLGILTPDEIDEHPGKELARRGLE